MKTILKPNWGNWNLSIKIDYNEVPEEIHNLKQKMKQESKKKISLDKKQGSKSYAIQTCKLPKMQTQLKWILQKTS